MNNDSDSAADVYAGELLKYITGVSEQEVRSTLDIHIQYNSDMCIPHHEETLNICISSKRHFFNICLYSLHHNAVLWPLTCELLHFSVMILWLSLQLQVDAFSHLLPLNTGLQSSTTHLDISVLNKAYGWCINVMFRWGTSALLWTPLLWHKPDWGSLDAWRGQEGFIWNPHPVFPLIKHLPAWNKYDLYEMYPAVSLSKYLKLHNQSTLVLK